MPFQRTHLAQPRMSDSPRMSTSSDPFARPQPPSPSRDPRFEDAPQGVFEVPASHRLSGLPVPSTKSGAARPVRTYSSMREHVPPAVSSRSIRAPLERKAIPSGFKAAGYSSRIPVFADKPLPPVTKATTGPNKLTRIPPPSLTPSAQPSTTGRAFGRDVSNTSTKAKAPSTLKAEPQTRAVGKIRKGLGGIFGWKTGHADAAKAAEAIRAAKAGAAPTQNTIGRLVERSALASAELKQPPKMASTRPAPPRLTSRPSVTFAGGVKSVSDRPESRASSHMLGVRPTTPGLSMPVGTAARPAAPSPLAPAPQAANGGATLVSSIRDAFPHSPRTAVALLLHPVAGDPSSTADAPADDSSMVDSVSNDYSRTSDTSAMSGWQKLAPAEVSPAPASPYKPSSPVDSRMRSALPLKPSSHNILDKFSEKPHEKAPSHLSRMKSSLALKRLKSQRFAERLVDTMHPGRDDNATPEPVPRKELVVQPKKSPMWLPWARKKVTDDVRSEQAGGPPGCFSCA